MFTDVESVTEMSLQENGLNTIEITVSEQMVKILKPLILSTGGFIPKTVGKLHDGTVVELHNVNTSVISDKVIKMEFEEQNMIVLENFNLETFLEEVEEEKRRYIESLSGDNYNYDDEDYY